MWLVVADFLLLDRLFFQVHIGQDMVRSQSTVLKDERSSRGGGGGCGCQEQKCTARAVWGARNAPRFGISGLSRKCKMQVAGVGHIWSEGWVGEISECHVGMTKNWNLNLGAEGTTAGFLSNTGRHG